MKLTKIAIALVAVLAMSAVVASGASATVELKSTGFANASLIGEDAEKTHVFKVDGQSVTCNNSVFETGTIAVPTNQITANAAYNNCTAFGFANATVNMGNCHYKITEPQRIDANNNNQHTAAVDVVCKDTSGKNGGANVINVNSSVFGSECSVSIGENTNTNHIIIENKPNDIHLNITVNSISATKNKDNGLCPLSGTGATNTATYEGTLTITELNGHAIEVVTN